MIKDTIDIHTHKADSRKEAIRSVTPSEYTALPSDFVPPLSIGIHPWHTDGGDWPKDLDTVRRAALTDRRIVAIGEIGLDALRGAPEALQIEIFEKQLEIARDSRLPVIIHCVKRYNEVLDILQKRHFDLPVVFHGFRGKPQLADNILSRGCYISLGERFNDATARIIPSDRLLVETDTSPADISQIIDSLAPLRQESPARLAEIVRQNIRRVFGKHT